MPINSTIFRLMRFSVFLVVVATTGTSIRSWAEAFSNSCNSNNIIIQQQLLRKSFDRHHNGRYHNEVMTTSSSFRFRVGNQRLSNQATTACHLSPFPLDWTDLTLLSLADCHATVDSIFSQQASDDSIAVLLLPLSLEVFDGSTIIDPVVVSSSFWNGLQRQLISLLIGQFLAGIVFTLLVTFFATQLSSLRDYLTTTFLSSRTGGDIGGVGMANDNNNNNNSNKSFIRGDGLSSSNPNRQQQVSPDYGKLLICLIIDIVGSSSELIPLLGEATDFITAPISATVLQKLYGGSRIIFFLEFAEEILPFTDIIPFATLCWVVDTYYPESDVAGVLQLGIFSSNNNNNSSSSGGIRREEDGWSNKE